MQTTVLTPLSIAVGGAIGTLLRYYTGLLMMGWSQKLPWATIFINTTGSFAIAFFGILTVAGARFPVSNEMRLVFMVGICGGYTTFSTFSLQTLDLLRNGAPGRAFMNVALSVLLGLGAVTAGYLCATSINNRQHAPALAAPMDRPAAREKN